MVILQRLDRYPVIVTGKRPLRPSSALKSILLIGVLVGPSATISPVCPHTLCLKRTNEMFYSVRPQPLLKGGTEQLCNITTTSLFSCVLIFPLYDGRGYVFDSVEQVFDWCFGRPVCNYFSSMPEHPLLETNERNFYSVRP